MVDGGGFIVSWGWFIEEKSLPADKEEKSRQTLLIYSIVVWIIGSLCGGLYHPMACEVTTFVLACGVLLVAVKSNSNIVRINKIIFLLFIFFVLGNALSAAFAVNKDLMSSEFAKLIFGILMLSIGMRLSLSNFRILWSWIPIIAACCSIVSINLSYVHSLNSFLIINDRLHGTIGYANTFAIFLLIGWLLGIRLISRAQNSGFFEFIITVSMFYQIYGVLLSGSRVATLLGIVLGVIVLWLMGGPGRFNVLFSSILAVVSSSISQSFLLSGQIVLLCLVQIIAVLTIVVAIKIRKVILFSRNTRLLLCVLLCLVLVLCNFQLKRYDLIIIDRFKSMSFFTSELQERLCYYHDAVKIIADYPWLGTGPGGWSSIQYKYQTAYYSTKWVHNELLQVALDNGLPTATVYSLLWLYLIVQLGKATKRNWNGNDRLFHFTWLMAIGVIFLHSLFDFTLTFPIMKAFFWISLGYFIRISTKGNNLYYIHLKKVSTCTVLVTLLYITPLMASSYLLYQAEIHYQRGELDTACRQSQKAIGINPWSAAGYCLLGDIYSERFYVMRMNDSGQIAIAINYYRKAITYDHYNPEYWAKLAYDLYYCGEFRGACIAYTNLVKIDPLRRAHWENYSIALLGYTDEAIRIRNLDSAEIALKKLLLLPKDIEKVTRKVSARSRYLKHQPDLEGSIIIEQSVFRANRLINLTSNIKQNIGKKRG